MELLNNIPPAFLLIIGAIALLALPANGRKVGAIALAALGFFAITQLSEGTRGKPGISRAYSGNVACRFHQQGLRLYFHN